MFVLCTSCCFQSLQTLSKRPLLQSPEVYKAECSTAPGFSNDTRPGHFEPIPHAQYLKCARHTGLALVLSVVLPVAL